jgi:hypothetical protein
MRDARERAGRRWFRAVLAGAVFAAIAIPGSALADPPGNNGTIKIDGVAFDDHPNNEPHVGCVFEVDFYGFDEGVGNATLTFDHHPPTGTGQIVQAFVDIGEDAAGGGTDLDASIQMNLGGGFVGITPHPKQGFHVKLTVNAPGSKGADTKHKVFWVTDCGDEYPPYDT